MRPISTIDSSSVITNLRLSMRNSIKRVLAEVRGVVGAAMAFLMATTDSFLSLTQ